MKKLVVVFEKLKSCFTRGSNPYGFKSDIEAWKKADETNPVSRKLLDEVNDMSSYPVRTKEDFRWFVLFNHIKTIDAKLNRGKEDTFLRRIQENIRVSAEKYLK